jgi:hypothetical protein
MEAIAALFGYLKSLFKPCQCNYCRYERGESVQFNSNQALKKEAAEWVKQAKKDVKLLEGLFR